MGTFPKIQNHVPNMETTISLREFARRIEVDPKTVRNAIKLGKISEGVTYIDDKPCIIFDIAAKEAKEIGLGTKTNYSKPKNEEPQQTKTQVLTDNEGEPIAGLDGNSTLPTAVRAEKIYKAQLACLLVDEKSGVLVKKEDVYAELYTFGVELKSGFLAIPNRITDELISKAGNRNEFHSLLSKTIEDELIKFSTYIDKKI